MVIQNAVYGGRSDMKTCGYNEDNNCAVSVTCVVKRQCDGKQNCSINVNQTLFDIDPCPGKSRYLYFEFICTDIEPGIVDHLLGEYSTLLPNKFSKCSVEKYLHSGEMITSEYNFLNILMIRLFFFSVSNVTLSSSVLPNEGYLEITINNEKNKVCDKSVGNKGKEVVCRQFGYQGVRHEVSLSFLDIGNSNNFSGEINCGGEEQTLSQCCFTNIIKDQTCSKFAKVSCK